MAQTLSSSRSGAEKQRLNDDKGSVRLDINSSRFGTFWAYHFADSYNPDNLNPSGFGGATLPGPSGPYNALSTGRDQMIVLNNSRTFRTNLVNEAHIGYVRLNNSLGVPKGGVGVSLADQGVPSGPKGIQQGFPQYAGVEMLYFNSFAVGTNRELRCDRESEKYCFASVPAGKVPRTLKARSL